MHKVTIKIRGKESRVYPIYTKAEADELGIDYKPWREAEAGDYIISDDGIVGELLYKKPIVDQSDGHHRPTYSLRASFGHHFWRKGETKRGWNGKCRYTPPEKYIDPTFWSKPPQVDRLKRLAFFFARTGNKVLSLQLALGDRDMIGQQYYRRQMKTERFDKMLQEALAKLLNDAGFSEKETLDMLKDSFETAKAKRDANAMIRAVENLLDMHGMKDKQVTKTTETLTAGGVRGLIDRMAVEMKGLEAKAVTVTTNNSNDEVPDGSEE